MSTYQRQGKPIHLIRRVNDSAYSIVAAYQIDYRGIVQYYRLAYNLHTLSRLKRVMEISLVKTLAQKFKTSPCRIYRKFQTLHTNELGTYKVLEVKVERKIGQTPLVARFGGVPLRWNKWVNISDPLPEPIWSGRSEVIQRLLAQKCELCGATETVMRSLEGGDWKSTYKGNSLVAYPTFMSGFGDQQVECSAC